ncbi:Protein of unknown function DUF2406 [Sarocladium implicatum]|nr:Protein of unknown function DUF2406 [Sarocladium implicatum]
MADQAPSYHQHPLPQPPYQQPYSRPDQGYQQQEQQQEQQSPAQQYYHPAISSQQQQQQQQQPQAQGQHTQPALPRPTHQRSSHSKSRTFSFQSQKSHKSSGSKDHTYHETHEEKEAKRLHSKADPSLAISEAEPSVVAMTQSSLAPLRSVQHRDAQGNPIADPDKSNPTRSRWERPLDTIRSFEAAIDGGYSRKSMHRSDTDSVAQWNRRSTFTPAPQPRFQRDSYYSQRPVSYRPEYGGYDGASPMTARNSYYDQQGGYGGPHGQGSYHQGPYQQGPPRRMSRAQTDPHFQHQGREQHVYPMPHNDRSYETVTSAAASGNSDHAGYQTDPTSSDNSSIERRSPAKRAEQPPNDYGIGFSQSQAYSSSNTFSVGVPNGGRVATHPLPATPGVQQQQQQPSPAVPRKDVPSVLRRQATTEQSPEKRKSWFSRRFSKNS